MHVQLMLVQFLHLEKKLRMTSLTFMQLSFIFCDLFLRAKILNLKIKTVKINYLNPLLHKDNVKFYFEIYFEKECYKSKLTASKCNKGMIANLPNILYTRKT